MNILNTSCKHEKNENYIKTLEPTEANAISGQITSMP